MQNAAKETVDAYIPRKCSATNRILGARDCASVQINVGIVDQDGVYHGDSTAFALSGFVRNNGDSDAHMNRLVAEAGLMKNLTKFPSQENYKHSNKK